MTPTVNAYLLLFRDSSPDMYRALSPEQRQRLLEQWNAWFDRLAAEGKVQGGHPLESTGRVVTVAGGRVVDGPYAEGKEAIGGYFYLTVASLDEATAIAKECPSVQMGLPMLVEVRPVAPTCPIFRAQAPALAAAAHSSALSSP